MNTRDRALFGTSALLYSGPLYAGLSGYGFETMPLFAAFFMVWLFVVRPGDWPQTRQDWMTPRAIAWPMLIFVIQMIVVGFCLAVGRGIGGLFDYTAALVLAFTIGVSFIGIFLAWVLRRGDDTPYLRVPGERLGLGSGIMDIATPVMPGRRNEQSFVDEISTYLAAFGSEPAPVSGLEPLIEMIERKNMTKPVLGAFRNAAERRVPFVQAEAMLALQPEVAERIAGRGQIGRAVAKAFETNEPAVVTHISELSRDTVRQVTSVVKEFPPVARIRQQADEMAKRSHAAADAMRELADALEGN